METGVADQIVDILNDLDADEVGTVLTALVAGFFEAITDCEIEAYCELAVFNSNVADLLAGERNEGLH